MPSLRCMVLRTTLNTRSTMGWWILWPRTAATAGALPALVGSTSNPFGTSVLSPPSATGWVVSGSFDQTDHWQVAPAHVQSVPAASLSASGPLRLDVVDAAGRVLKSQSFASVDVALDTFRTGFYQ